MKNGHVLISKKCQEVEASPVHNIKPKKAGSVLLH